MVIKDFLTTLKIPRGNRTIGWSDVLTRGFTAPIVGPDLTPRGNSGHFFSSTWNYLPPDRVNDYNTGTMTAFS